MLTHWHYRPHRAAQKQLFARALFQSVDERALTTTNAYLLTRCRQSLISRRKKCVDYIPFCYANYMSWVSWAHIIERLLHVSL